MTSAWRKAAGLLTVLESIWALYSVYTVTPAACSATGCPGPAFSPVFSWVLIALSVVIFVDGILGVWGASFAYVPGAILSATLLLLLGYWAWADSGFSYLATDMYDAAAGAALAALATAANLVAIRARSRLSEQANPMNLPVFG